MYNNFVESKEKIPTKTGLRYPVFKILIQTLLYLKPTTILLLLNWVSKPFFVVWHSVPLSSFTSGYYFRQINMCPGICTALALNALFRRISPAPAPPPREKQWKYKKIDPGMRTVDGGSHTARRCTRLLLAWLRVDMTITGRFHFH